MKLYLTANRFWTGTQADAKLYGKDVEQIEVPTDKPGLVAWLQEEWNGFYAEVERLKGEAPAEAPRPEGVAPPVPDQPMATRPPVPVSGDLPAQVLELEGAALFNVLQAALDRLHETAGDKGWSAFAKHATAWGSSQKATDRGLGMLVLAGLAATVRDAS
jgi:hypothetical protein